MYSARASDTRFYMPTGFAVVGPTISGKLEFLFNIIPKSESIMTKTSDRIIYCSGEWQSGFEKVQQDRLPIEFI